jgi:hypothetical protein
MVSFFSFLLGIGVSLLVLGLTEAVIKPLATKTTKYYIKAYVPKLLDYLDEFLPVWFGNLSEEEIRQELIRFLWTEATEQGERIEETQVEEIINTAESTYSFFKNASKLLS